MHACTPKTARGGQPSFFTRLALTAVLLGLAFHLCSAMINPAFTPVNLVEDARLIVAGVLEGDEKGERWTLARTQVLKGEGAGAPHLLLALLNARDTDNARAFLRSSVGSEAILFQGRDAGFLLVRDVWLGLKLAEGGAWRVSEFNDQDMLKTYTGGADKLIEMACYIMRDEDADVPVAVGVRWREAVRIARLPGQVTGMAALALGAGRSAQLLVASGVGDRLFSYDRKGKSFEDLTDQTGLDTASRAFAFVDLDRDGRDDLLSWDGEHLSTRLRRQDGGFGPLLGVTEPLWPGGCNGLAPISPMQDGSPGVLVSSAWPRLLRWDGKGWSVFPLPGEHAGARPAGSAPAALAADWDGDGYADVLQLRDGEALLWKGKEGGFGPPEPCGLKGAASPVRWAVGDFDTDGRLDLAVNGPETCELWENASGGRFRAVIRYAGSLLFRQEPGAADCLTTDLNHDGRPDLAVLYEQGPFFYHFNRGFRCMAEEGQLTLADAGSAGGPKCATAGDFDGDGSLDLVVAFAGGNVFCFFNDLREAPGLWVRLPPGYTGPVTVSAWQGAPYASCVGTSTVAGHEPNYFPLRKHGPCTLKWRLPGGPPRELTTEDGAEVVLRHGL